MMASTEFRMPFTIPDDVLTEAGVTEREARIELACRLFDVGRLDLWPAAKLAGLGRAEFEGELRARDIPAYRPTLDHLAQDVAALSRLRHSGD
jgi:predicted HTH domain antitoxin